ncbi:MAG: peptidoglycan-binding domain-containing protein [Candidatus Pacebacteria bacterium]|nr:peptidoglycan-binding domain-containing protein [Candidatus Paceibacterota bacterium]
MQTSHPSGLSSSQIQSILDVLASFNADASTIANVRISLGGTLTGSATSAAVHVFNTNLTVGSLGSEVRALQAFLNARGYTVATSGAGSPGNETTTFGQATKMALIRFQKASGISPALGNCGPITRAYISSH